MNKLYVHYQKQLVGEIEYDSMENSYAFNYKEEWIKDGFEISPSLKFNNKISANVIKYFIENLLPEGEGLEELSMIFHISKANKFLILKHIGLDTAGALTFTADMKYEAKTNFREISKEELALRVAKREEQSIQVWDGKPRLSVAGVQAKLPIVIIGDKYGLGEGDICSTHILKFNKKNENIILNEYISLRLSKALGFNVANVEYKKVGEENVLFVERFDRKIINDKLVQREHIIDSAQALGLPVSYKYERNMGSNLKEIREGVSFSKLFALAKEAVTPILFKEQIINFSMMNLILGNSDAHGKNISFFVSKKGLSVAPFYDLVNITMYNNYDNEMAMGIDDEFEFSKIKEYDFREFFEENNISLNQYFKDFKKLVKKLQLELENFDFIEKALFIEEQEFIKEYVDNIKHRVNKLSSVLNNIRFTLPYEGQSEEEFIDENKAEIKRILTKDYKDSNSDKITISLYLEKLKNRLIQVIL